MNNKMITVLDLLSIYYGGPVSIHRGTTQLYFGPASFVELRLKLCTVDYFYFHIANSYNCLVIGLKEVD